MSVWTHRFQATKLMPVKTRITVSAGLHKIGLNQKPYFSVTGETETKVSGRWVDESAGLIPDKIVAAWPELAPVIALHLADENGTPLYARENGWYWLSGYLKKLSLRSVKDQMTPNEPPEVCITYFAKLMRISFEATAQLANVWANEPDAKNAFYTWLEMQTDRFKTEADTAIGVLDRLIASQEE